MQLYWIWLQGYTTVYSMGFNWYTVKIESKRKRFIFEDEHSKCQRCFTTITGDVNSKFAFE